MDGSLAGPELVIIATMVAAVVVVVAVVLWLALRNGR